MIASFDLDGVINMDGLPGVYPGPNDIIITGRSFEEIFETKRLLKKLGINNNVYYNPLKFDEKKRVSSGIFKGYMINLLNNLYDKNIVIHFDDDPIQIEQIKIINKSLNVVLLSHDLVEKENVRRDKL